jgi:hypothetical protein
MFTINSIDSNYSEIETGFISDKSFEAFVKANQLEIVEHNGQTAIVRAEWGNSEGYDTFEIEFENTMPLDDYFAMVMDELPAIVAEYPSLDAFAKAEFEKLTPNVDVYPQGTQLDMVNWLKANLK